MIYAGWLIYGFIGMVLFTLFERSEMTGFGPDDTEDTALKGFLCLLVMILWPIFLSSFLIGVTVSRLRAFVLDWIDNVMENWKGLR